MEGLLLASLQNFSIGRFGLDMHCPGVSSRASRRFCSGFADLKPATSKAASPRRKTYGRTKAQDRLDVQSASVCLRAGQLVRSGADQEDTRSNI